MMQSLLSTKPNLRLAATDQLIASVGVANFLGYKLKVGNFSNA